MSWFCYIVECSDKSLYTGVTTDVIRRVKEHNSSKGAKYTRSKRPVKLVRHFECGSRSSACKVEAFIKTLSHKEKRQLILRDYVQLSSYQTFARSD